MSLMGHRMLLLSHLSFYTSQLKRTYFLIARKRARYQGTKLTRSGTVKQHAGKLCVSRATQILFFEEIYNLIYF